MQNCAIPQTFWTGWRLLNLPGTLLHKKGNSRARSYDIYDLLRFVHSWFIRKSFSSYTTLRQISTICLRSIGEQISKFYVILTKLKPMFPHNSIVNYFSMLWIKHLNLVSSYIRIVIRLSTCSTIPRMGFFRPLKYRFYFPEPNLTVILKVPNCDIFGLLHSHDFYSHKAYCIWVNNFGAEDWTI